MGWLRDFTVQQLQELLQTYFDAVRHCLVCRPTVDATNFCCRQKFLSTEFLGTPFVNPQEYTEMTDHGTAKRETD